MQNHSSPATTGFESFYTGPKALQDAKPAPFAEERLAAGSQCFGEVGRLGSGIVQSLLTSDSFNLAQSCSSFRRCHRRHGGCVHWGTKVWGILLWSIPTRKLNYVQFISSRMGQEWLLNQHCTCNLHGYVRKFAEKTWILREQTPLQIEHCCSHMASSFWTWNIS